MGWPTFRKTLGFGALAVAAVAHVVTRTIELATQHLLYAPQGSDEPHR